MPVERIDRIAGTGLPILGDNIDTDRIIPARFLRSVSFEGLERDLFADDRAQVAAQGSTHAMSDPRFTNASILIVNANFGCGSSREHAPQAIRRRGFRAIVGQSFSEIFSGNACAIGLPCVTADALVVASLQRLAEHDAGALIDVDLEALQVTAKGSAWTVSMPSSAREAFLSGTWDATGLLLDDYHEVETVAERLPYMKWGPSPDPSTSSGSP